jgi:hypothetical protein
MRAFKKTGKLKKWFYQKFGRHPTEFVCLTQNHKKNDKNFQKTV